MKNQSATQLFLCCLLSIVLFCSPAQAATAASSWLVLVSSGQAGSAVVAFVKENGTALYRGEGTCLEEADTFSFQAEALIFAGEQLAALGRESRFEPAGGFSSHLRVAWIQPANGRVKEIVSVPDVSPQDDCFCITAAGQIVLCDSRVRTRLSFYDVAGALIGRYDCSSVVRSLSVNRSGTAVYVETALGTAALPLSSSGVSQAPLTQIPGFPQGPFRFLDDALFEGGDGGLYRLEGQRARLLWEGNGRPTPMAYQPGEGFIYRLEPDGAVFAYSLAESQTFDVSAPVEGIVGLYSSKEGCVMLTASGSVHKLPPPENAASSQPAEPSSETPAQSSSQIASFQPSSSGQTTTELLRPQNGWSPGDLNRAWKAAQPAEGTLAYEPSGAYGSLTAAGQKDAVAFLNFCRAACGLSPMTPVQTALGQKAAYCAANGTSPSDVAPLLSNGVVAHLPALTGAPFHKALPPLLAGDPAARHRLLFPGASGVTLGLWQAPAGNSTLFASTQGDTGKTVCCAWPSGGAFPAQWACDSELWSVSPGSGVSLSPQARARITDLSSGTAEVREAGGGLSLQGGLLLFRRPSSCKAGKTYQIEITGVLCGGRALKIQYTTALAALAESPGADPVEPRLTILRQVFRGGEFVYESLPDPLIMQPGDHLRLHCAVDTEKEEGSPVFSSRNPIVASVTSAGLLEAHTAGETVIDVSLGGVSASVAVEVTETPASSGTGGTKITSTQYRCDSLNGLVTGIPRGLTARPALEAFAPAGEVFLFDAEGNRKTAGKVGTGMELRLIRNGEILDRLTIIIEGDLTGSGTLTQNDRWLLRDYLLEKTPLSPLALLAADLDANGVVDVVDLYFLTRHYEWEHGRLESPWP